MGEGTGILFSPRKPGSQRNKIRDSAKRREETLDKLEEYK